MKRRRFLSCITSALAGPAILPAAPALASSGRSPIGALHLQDCRIAGSDYYDCRAILPQLRICHALQLHHEPGNPHDPRVIEVFRGRHKLGYLPRIDNAAVASLLERAHELRAEILAIDDPDDEWEPVRMRLWVNVTGSRPDAHRQSGRGRQYVGPAAGSPAEGSIMEMDRDIC